MPSEALGAKFFQKGVKSNDLEIRIMAQKLVAFSKVYPGYSTNRRSKKRIGPAAHVIFVYCLL